MTHGMHVGATMCCFHTLMGRHHMTSRTSVSGENVLRDPRDFSLVLGGPLFQLLRRLHLSDDALALLRQRIIVIALLAWLPLLGLSALERQTLGGSAAVPFLLDVDVHVRFLVALPLLIVAELVVHRRMRFVVTQFLERQLIPESAMTPFEGAMASAFRLRNSVLAEVLLIAFVYGVGVLIIWRQYMILDTTTWYAVLTAAWAVTCEGPCGRNFSTDQMRIYVITHVQGVKLGQTMFAREERPSRRGDCTPL
jgi:hypothetical protein